MVPVLIMGLGDEPRMTPSDDVLAAHLDGESVLLDMETKRYYRLNETASHVWRGLEQGLDRRQIRVSLKESFEIGDEEIDPALDRLLESFARQKLVVVRREP